MCEEGDIQPSTSQEVLREQDPISSNTELLDMRFLVLLASSLSGKGIPVHLHGAHQSARFFNSIFADQAPWYTPVILSLGRLR
jgi:hypothetical protein